LRRHPWFKPVDWDTLETKEQIPPFKPDVRRFLLLLSNYTYNNCDFIYRRIKPTLMLPMNWKNCSWKITL